MLHASLRYISVRHYGIEAVQVNDRRAMASHGFMRAKRRFLSTDLPTSERPQGRLADPPPVGVKEIWGGPAFP
uniref:Uncharacterized protein n=1 Tax=mine drainage metagenome TaxID=410659 RepID=E6PPP6_9ZZZZ